MQFLNIRKVSDYKDYNFIDRKMSEFAGFDRKASAFGDFDPVSPNYGFVQHRKNSE
jgi:hypothetical protein